MSMNTNRAYSYSYLSVNVSIFIFETPLSCLVLFGCLKVFLSRFLLSLCYPFPPSKSITLFLLDCLSFPFQLFFSPSACRWENSIEVLATVMLDKYIYNALFLYFGMFIFFHLNHLACQNCDSVSGQLLFNVRYFTVHSMFLSRYLLKSFAPVRC